MRLAARIAGACAAAAVLLVPAQTAGAATRLVRAEPGLKPAFRAEMPDYTVWCKAGTPVRLSISAPSGTTVAVNDGPARSGNFERSVPLVPGRRLRLRVKSGSSARNYSVRCLPSDFPRWTAKRYGKPQTSFYILTPNDNRPIPGYLTVVDSYGVPIWWIRDSLALFDGQLLPNGHLAWTHWSGSHPDAGPFEERTLDGRLVRYYNTVGHVTNQHELQVLPNGNALLMAYPPREHVDLSDYGGPSDARVLDGEIQEVSPTGELVWAWNTKDHVALAETGRWLHVLLFEEKPVHLRDGRAAYDIVHMNSIEQVGGDTILFSARYEDAVYAVDKRNDKIIWKLGGRKTRKTLKLVGDSLPASEEFGGQHDARAVDGGRIVTLYDNGTLRKRPPRALAFKIDLQKKTATLIREITFKPAADSVCCGGARMLPGGNWVVAWGHTPWITEQTKTGDRVFTLQYARDDVMSYRAEPVLPGRLQRSSLRVGMDAMAP